jgi:nuclear pore complex protein Nup62
MLMSEMLVAEREQADIDQALDHIEQQQKDLMATLEIYEKTAEETFNAQSGGLRALDTGPADTERDRKSVSHRWGIVPDWLDGLTLLFLLVTC